MSLPFSSPAFSFSLSLASNERGAQKMARAPKLVFDGPRARTRFARDYTESPTCRGPVFTRPRNLGLDAACLRHPSETPWARDAGRVRRREGKRDKRAPIGIRIRALRDDRIPTSLQLRSPEIPGFCREDRPRARSFPHRGPCDAGTCRN